MKEPLDLRLLATFVQVARGGTISAAAVLVGRTQSAVTMQIQRLEKSLGQNLLHRTGSGVRLTESGMKLLGYAERILELHDEALSALSSKGLHGSITLGSSEVYLAALFPELLKSFSIIHPQVQINIVAATTIALQSLLHLRQVDLALVSTSRINDPDVIRVEPLVWFGNKPSLEMYDFGETIRLALSASNNMDHRAARRAMERAKLRYDIAYASNGLAGLIGLTRSGMAISVISKGAVPPDLHILSDGLPTLPSLGMKIAFSDGGHSPAAQVFADHVKRILPLL